MAVQTAEEQAKEQQAGLLKAIAEQGSRGAAFYAEQAAQAQARKQAGIDAAITRADDQGGPGAAGIPDALRAQLSGQAAAVGEARAADVSAASTNFNQDQAALTSANDSYMNQLTAAIPLVRVRAEEAAAQQQRQIALQKQLDENELARSQIGLESSRLGLASQRESNAAARAATAAGKVPSVAQQKYDDDQAIGEHQDAVMNLVNGANASTQNAFIHIMSTGGSGGGPVKTLAEALNALQEGLVGDTVQTGFGPPVLTAPIYQDFGRDVDASQLAAFINAFFAAPDAGGGSLPGASSGGGGGGTSSIPGIGNIVSAPGGTTRRS